MADKKVFGRFKLTSGVHVEGGNMYRKGDTFESVSDLRKYNYGTNRYVLLEGAEAEVAVEDVVDEEVETDVVVAPEEDKDDFYQDMTVAELRSMAEEGEISLEGCRTKKEIIARLSEYE